MAVVWGVVAPFVGVPLISIDGVVRVVSVLFASVGCVG